MNGVIEQPQQPQNVASSSAAMQMAEPLHLQRLEAALDMRPFMHYARDILSHPLTSPEDTEADDSHGNETDDDDGVKLPGETKKKKSKKLGTKQGK